MYLLVFTDRRSGVAEIALYGQAFYFDEDVRTFAVDNARFRVERDDGIPLLIPVS